MLTYLTSTICSDGLEGRGEGNPGAAVRSMLLATSPLLEAVQYSLLQRTTVDVADDSVAPARGSA